MFFNLSYTFISQKCLLLFASAWTGARYRTASVVALNVCLMMDRLDRPKRTMLQQFLHFTRATIVCELLQKAYQHIVSLDHLPSDQLKASHFSNPSAPSGLMGGG